MKNYNWTLRLSILTIPLLFVVVFLMGAGHGTYIPAMGLFPFSMLSILLFNKITMPFVIIAFIQYPLYGFVIDKTKSNENKRTMFLLLFLHIFLAFIIIAAKGSE